LDEKFLEQAAQLELMARESGIAAARHGPETSPSFDGVHCVDPACQCEIPAGRLALGKIRCVACQAIKENRRGP
jgi:hypothetical protein